MPSPVGSALIGSQIYEDIGALKAMMTSIEAKLDAGVSEFRDIREDQANMQAEIAEIKAAGASRTETMDRIEGTLDNVDKRVDELMALRHRLGGAIFLITLLGGFIWGSWGYLERFIIQIGGAR